MRPATYNLKLDRLSIELYCSDFLSGISDGVF